MVPSRTSAYPSPEEWNPAARWSPRTPFAALYRNALSLQHYTEMLYPRPLKRQIDRGKPTTAVILTWAVCKCSYGLANRKQCCRIRFLGLMEMCVTCGFLFTEASQSKAVTYLYTR